MEAIISGIDNSLIYVSRERIPPPSDEAAIAEIVTVSRARNATLGVTGTLVSTRDYFAQILEGPSEAIDALMDSIHRDLRHDHVTVLRIWPIAQRSFAGWSMAYSGTSNYLARHIGPLLDGGVAPDDVRISRLIGVMTGLTR
ncbi:MAG: BLUF domain-containing protein [Sphingomonadales bacterium]|nr:MAG: BLUF domain-containing protein [Sphingomonadales bacterium]